MRRFLLVGILLLFAGLASACADQAAAPTPSGPTPVVVRLLNLDLALTGMPPTRIPDTPTPPATMTPFPTFTPLP
ncbi:MAG: hypothetical protein ACKOC5_04185, partial [Chloroflexota bacterium]